LVRDIGRDLGCGAHLYSLRRLGSGRFSIEESISLENLKKVVKDGNWMDQFYTISEVLDLSTVKVSFEQASRIQKGCQVNLEGSKKISDSPVKIVDEEDKLIALGIIKDDLFLQPIKVFNLGLY
jgi:tRNA pseudouridine55 synthase